MQAKAVVMDFSRLEDERGWNGFAAALDGLDIGVLGASHRTRTIIPITLTWM